MPIWPTWPFFAEQFMNEKLGIGVSVGATKPTKTLLNGAKDGSGEGEAVVGTEQVKMALNKLMDGGADGEDRRRKAQELNAKGKAALENGRIVVYESGEWRIVVYAKGPKQNTYEFRLDNNVSSKTSIIHRATHQLSYLLPQLSTCT